MRLNAAAVEALADPAVAQNLTDGLCHHAARAADAGGARHAPQGGDREVVGDHQGVRRQGGVGWAS